MFRTGRPKDQVLEPVNFTETLGPKYCDFPVLYEASGKTKVIDLPNGDVLFKNPASRVTFTNLAEPTHRLSYVATGTVRLTELENGDLSLVTTGRTVILDENIGIFVPIGRFTTIIDDGNFSAPVGYGRLIDVCARLA